MELPTASQEEQELQTSQESVGELAGCRLGAGILSGTRGLCWSPWLEGHQRAERGSLWHPQGPGTAAEGGDYSSPQGLPFPGEKRMFPILPSHQGWVFSSPGPAGTSLKHRGQRKPRPSPAQQRDLGRLLRRLLNSAAGIWRGWKSQKNITGLGWGSGCPSPAGPGCPGGFGAMDETQREGEQTETCPPWACGAAGRTGKVQAPSSAPDLGNDLRRCFHLVPSRQSRVSRCPRSS